MLKKITVLVMAFVLSLMPVSAFCDAGYDDVIRTTADYIMSAVPNPTVASVGGEWSVIALARSGLDIDREYFDKYYQNVCEYVKDHSGILHERKYTEYSRVVLALTAIGKDPRDVCGYDLISPLCDFDKIVWQGINGPVWALIALDSGKYEVNESEIKEKYLKYILSHQNSDGGWSFSEGDVSDPDITAMSLCALSGYKDNPQVSSSLENALEFLSSSQNSNGGYVSYGEENCESAAQVLTALSALSVSVVDPRFVKNGKSVFDNIVNYSTKNGGFRHVIGDNNNNIMSTEQALYAIVSANRVQSGKTYVFDMSDISNNNYEKNNSQDYGLPGKNPAVKKRPFIAFKTFADISECGSKNKIEALASRNIVNGINDTEFAPQKTITRAEFAALTARSLSLFSNAEKIFDDVSETDWFFASVAASYKYGIIKGVSDKLFSPNGLITMQEAAVMSARAARLCGINASYTSDDMRDILSVYEDYTSVSSWAKDSVTFCIDKGIIEADGMRINPCSYVSRSQMAEILYNILDRANLL